MRPCGSKRNLQRGSTAAPEAKLEKTPKKDSWQLKVLMVKGLKEDCWLINSTANVHICNNQKLMTDFIEKPIRVRGSTADGMSPGRGIVRIRLILKDRSKGVILNLRDIYYLSNNPSNLINLRLLNNANILYDNERHNFYNKVSKKPLAFAEQWEQSFLLYPLNLSVSATKLLKIGKNTYQDAEPKVHQI